MNPMVTPEIFDGHRRILAALREFRTTDPWHCAGNPDAPAMQALVAFMRQEILPFASREEAALPSGSEEHEATAFEHAFLAAEIDALDRAVRGLAEGCARTPVDRSDRGEEIRRRIHRIEAVLELHAGRQVERWGDAASPGGEAGAVGEAIPAPTAADRAPTSRARGARSLAATEIDAILRRGSWGLLSTAAGNRPYAVPVAYGYDGECFYVASGAGRKVQNLEANPIACLTVLEVEDAGSRWRSVVVTGRIEWVHGIRESFAALGALRRQWSGLPAASLRDAARLRGARVFRIVPAEITGRSREG